MNLFCFSFSFSLEAIIILSPPFREFRSQAKKSVVFAYTQGGIYIQFLVFCPQNWKFVDLSFKFFVYIYLLLPIIGKDQLLSNPSNGV